MTFITKGVFVFDPFELVVWPVAKSGVGKFL